MIVEGFFIILVQLGETLDKCKPDWPSKEKKFLATFSVISRITVAYDVAALFKYLHEDW
jgi:hypothetical protein